MQEISLLFQPITQILLAVLLAVLIAVGIQIFRITSNVANIVKRVETLTDITGWLGFFRKFKSKK
jgi:hypothetical protein